MKRGKRRGLWKWLLAGFVALVVIGALNSKSKPSSSASSSTQHPASTAQPAASPPPASTDQKPGPNSDAVSYIKNLGLDAGKVQANVQAVQIAVGGLQQSTTQTNLDQLAQLAQQAHDNLDSVRQDFANTTTTDGQLGNAELEVFAAANDLKNSMGALVAYTGNPATLAHFTTQYQQATAEWDDGIKSIWAAAQMKNPPSI